MNKINQMKQKAQLLPFLMMLSLSCGSKTSNVSSTSDQDSRKVPQQITIEILQDGVRSIIEESSEIKTIAKGLNWAEGPLWLKEQKVLIFSDVPENRIYSWSETAGQNIWLEPSGYTGPKEVKREGSNGLLLNENGQLVLCQHGDRRMAILDSPLSAPEPKFTTIADRWTQKRFNSPNDAAYNKSILYFTDPPYGLPKQDDDPEKELDFSGVYKVDRNGFVTMVIDSLSRPNGIAFSPKQENMYVANSDPQKAIWMKYKMDTEKMEGKVLYDATDLVGKVNGLPDGLKVHPGGYVFATGPGGVWIFSPDDKVSARIHIPQATANCAFDDSYSNLYIAADSTVIKVSLKQSVAQK